MGAEERSTPEALSFGCSLQYCLGECGFFTDFLLGGDYVGGSVSKKEFFNLLANFCTQRICN